MKKLVFIACAVASLPSLGARILWDTPPGGGAAVVYGTLVDPIFPPSTLTTWPTPNSGYGQNYINFSIEVTDALGRPNWAYCIITPTSNNGDCSNYPAPPSYCNSAEEASAFFASMAGMRFRMAGGNNPKSGTITLACHSGTNPIGYMTGPRDVVVDPTPVSCITRDLVLATSGTVGETGIRFSDSLEVVCTGSATLRLELAGGGNVRMTGGISARVSFAGDKASIAINAVPNASIPVTARLLTPALSAGTYSGSIVLTTTVE